jgi:hypothetical protein
LGKLTICANRTPAQAVFCALANNFAREASVGCEPKPTGWRRSLEMSIKMAARRLSAARLPGRAGPAKRSPGDQIEIIPN